MTWEQFCANYKPGTWTSTPKGIEQAADSLEHLLARALARLDQRAFGRAA